MVSAHVCRLGDPWPTGHPLPPVDPAKLRGPEPGTFMLFQPAPIRNHLRNAETGETVIQTIEQPPEVVRVVEQSYVWSPGECRHRGGHRLYDSSVVERGPGGYRRVVVNDKDLSPLPMVSHWGQDPVPVKVVTVYTVAR